MALAAAFSSSRSVQAQPAGGDTNSELALDEIEAALAADRAEAAPSASAPPKAATGRAASMNPDLTLILDLAAAYFSQDEPLQTGGHDPTKTGFNLQQLELATGASVDPYFRFDANLVFAAFGVELEEAYGTTLDLPFGLQARFGQFLTRFGRINATHLHAWNFVDQPLAIGRVFGAEGNRGLGFELSYLTPLPWYVELVASATDAAGEGTARSFYGPRDLGVHSLADLLYVTALKQFFPVSEDWSLFFGISAALGPNASGRDNRSEVYGADLYLKYRSITGGSDSVFSIQSEWLYRRRQVPGDVLWDTTSYTEALYRPSRRWGVAGRYEFGSPSYSSSEGVAPDPLDPSWSDNRHRFSASATFSPTEFSRLRLQGSRDLPAWRDGIWAAFLAVELVAGAHGAHAF